jgi:hypothetical protein
MVFLHLPGGGGAMVTASCTQLPSIPSPQKDRGRLAIVRLFLIPALSCFAALPRSDALSPLPTCPILCGRIIAGDQHDPSGTPRPLWTAATRYSPNVGEGIFYELRL